MADVTISYKNNEIATMNATGVKTLLTGDTFCEDDIVVAYTKPAAPSPTLQSKTVYPSASDQTTTPDQGYDGLSSVTSKGVLLTNLTAENIKKDVVVKVGDSVDDDRIISVTGTYEGSGGGGGGGGSVNVSWTTNVAKVYWLNSSGVAQTTNSATSLSGCLSGSLITMLQQGPEGPSSPVNMTLKYSVSLGSRATYNYMYIYQAN